MDLETESNGYFSTSDKTGNMMALNKTKATKCKMINIVRL